VGGDKNFDTADFVASCRKLGCTPHVSQNASNRRSAIDGRTTRHPGYRISTIKRKRIEEPFGWMKTVGGLRKTRHRGRENCSLPIAVAAFLVCDVRHPAPMGGQLGKDTFAFSPQLVRRRRSRSTYHSRIRRQCSFIRQP
jgi:hypothetical protein